jgi:hypothetical protein
MPADADETPRQKLAQAARQNDIQASNETARAATQAAILINGGAATAILAFLSNYLTKTPAPPPGILGAAALSLLGYAFGVCFGAWSMWCSSQAAAQFGLRWEAFLDGNNDGATNYLTAGNGWLGSHRNYFGVSILLFFFSSLALALGFFFSGAK